MFQVAELEGSRAARNDHYYDDSFCNPRDLVLSTNKNHVMIT